MYLDFRRAIYLFVYATVATPRCPSKTLQRSSKSKRNRFRRSHLYPIRVILSIPTVCVPEIYTSYYIMVFEHDVYCKLFACTAGSLSLGQHSPRLASLHSFPLPSVGRSSRYIYIVLLP